SYRHANDRSDAVAAEERQDSRSRCEREKRKEPQPQVIDRPVILPDLRIHGGYRVATTVGAVSTHGILPGFLGELHHVRLTARTYIRRPQGPTRIQPEVSVALFAGAGIEGAGWLSRASHRLYLGESAEPVPGLGPRAEPSSARRIQGGWPAICACR